MTRQETEAKVRAVISTVLKRPMNHTAVDEVGQWDSLDWINILFGLEEAFDIEFGDNDAFDRLLNIDGLVVAVERQLAAKAADRA